MESEDQSENPGIISATVITKQMVVSSTFLPLDFFIVPNHTHVANWPFYLRPSSFEIKILEVGRILQFGLAYFLWSNTDFGRGSYAEV